MFFNKKKEIDASLLAEIISYNHENGSDGNAELILKAYMNSIHIKAKNHGFEEHIVIKEATNKRGLPVFAKELGYTLYHKYKVVISNLSINMEQDPNAKQSVGSRHSVGIFLNPIEIDEYAYIDQEVLEKKYVCRMYFEFKRNCFKGIEDVSSIVVKLGHYVTLFCKENYFENIDFNVRAQNVGVTLLNIKENTFKSNSVSIVVANTKDYISGSWRLKGEIAGKIFAANKLEKFINEDISIKASKILSENNSLKEITKKDALKVIMYNLDKTKVIPEQVERLGGKSVIKLSNNKCDTLDIYGIGSFHFSGKNFIKRLAICDHFLGESESSLLPTISWGAHQKLVKESWALYLCKKIFDNVTCFLFNNGRLDTLKSYFPHKKLYDNLEELWNILRYFFTPENLLDSQHFLTHKKIFIVLKQRAITNGDIAQEMILQREIAKCDHAIAKSEKWRAWQDRMIFWFSKWISNYGTSWARPLGWLIALNLLIAVSAQYSIPGHELKTWAILSYIFSGTDFNAVCINAVSNICNIWAILSDPQTLVIFLKLLNPTSYLPGLFELKSAGPNGWELLSLFILQKIILAFTLYEMIKIFRRFGRR